MDTALLSEEQRAAYEKLLKKRSTTLKRSATSSDKQKMYNRVPRLRLDDALKQLSTGDLDKAMEGWSEARVRAYRLIQENPNAYYYRFNAPGEQQRNGKFTPVRPMRAVVSLSLSLSAHAAHACECRGLACV